MVTLTTRRWQRLCVCCCVLAACRLCFFALNFHLPGLFDNSALCGLLTVGYRARSYMSATRCGLPSTPSGQLREDRILCFVPVVWPDDEERCRVIALTWGSLCKLSFCLWTCSCKLEARLISGDELRFMVSLASGAPNMTAEGVPIIGLPMTCADTYPHLWQKVKHSSSLQ
jgi:hypothetical protein